MKTVFNESLQEPAEFSKALRKQWKEDQYIRMLDPLQADHKLKQLPAYNQEGNVAAIKELAYQLLPDRETACSFTYPQAAAAMRDMGIVMGSLKRHEQEPVECLPGLEAILMILAEKTSMPPRDTLVHYTSWNPEGDRRRTHTGSSDEQALIESINLAILPLSEAILLLQDLLKLSFSDPEFVSNCNRISDLFQGMISGIVHARKNVSTSFFTKELRLYFDAVQIGGKSYVGPGGGEMPMFVFDHLLWSSLVNEAEYVKFKEKMLPYILPILQKVYVDQEGKPSLLDRFNYWSKNQSFKINNSQEIIKAVNKLCRLLKSFRMPHISLAKEAFAKGKHIRSHGSGGYTPDTLSLIIELMLNRFEKKDRAVEEFEKLPKLKF